MRTMEYTEHLIGKRLADLLRAGEIQYEGLKSLKAQGQLLGLRARSQLLAFMLRQPDGHRFCANVYSSSLSSRDLRYAASAWSPLISSLNSN